MVATQFARALPAQACDGVLCADLWITYANIAFTWAAVYSLIYWAALAGRSADTWLAKGSAHLAVVLAFAVLTAHGLFSWAFTIANGFPPSPDVSKFLIVNAVRVPHHTLQSSPALSIAVAIAILVAAPGLAWVMARFAGRTRGSLRPRIALTALAFAAVALSAPYAGANVSAVALNTFLAKRLDPLDAAPDPALAKTFVPAAPYAPAPEAARRGPVIVILVESLRRDLIETRPDPIPFLRRLAEDEAIVFDKAYATASHSNYADVAFWYSRYPMRSLDWQRYAPDAADRGLSLFQAFRRHGYATAYISSQNELWGDMIHWLRGETDHFYHSEDYAGETWDNADDERGLRALIAQGIATAGKIEDGETLRIARRWIDGLGGRRDFLLAMNLQNTHFSYVVPPGGVRPYAPDEFDFPAIYYRWPETRKATVRNRYLNAVANVDRMLGEFAGYLKAKGLWDDATFVVVGDSGEAFYEHGFGNHSGPMYDEVMRTFALIKPPRASAVARGRFDGPISHLDIAPTVLALEGLPVPGSFQGRSIFARGPRGPVFMHSNAIVKQTGVVDWPWKLLHTHFPHDLVELYDLESDPQERINLAARRADVAGRLGETLATWMKRQLLYYGDEAYYGRFDPPR